MIKTGVSCIKMKEVKTPYRKGRNQTGGTRKSLTDGKGYKLKGKGTETRTKLTFLPSKGRHLKGGGLQKQKTL